jgi:hypothetical protein
MNKYIPILSILCVSLSGCGIFDNTPTSDEIQTNQQEKLLKEGTSEVGMPAIKNFRERKLLKQILELRDQADFITYTYVENAMPNPIHGVTSLGGKFTFLGVSVGYGIPYSTQFTSPQKLDSTSTHYITMPQADPNGLFAPASADGTWIMMKDPSGNVKPQYIEPKIATFTYKLPVD